MDDIITLSKESLETLYQQYPELFNDYSALEELLNYEYFDGLIILPSTDAVFFRIKDSDNVSKLGMDLYSVIKDGSRYKNALNSDLYTTVDSSAALAGVINQYIVPKLTSDATFLYPYEITYEVVSKFEGATTATIKHKDNSDDQVFIFYDISATEVEFLENDREQIMIYPTSPKPIGFVKDVSVLEVISRLTDLLEKFGYLQH